MALQCNYTTRFGFVQTDAYIKIATFDGDKTKIDLVVAIYASQAARDSGADVLETKPYRIPYSDGLSIAALYTHLKTKPEFGGAMDV